MIEKKKKHDSRVKTQKWRSKAKTKKFSKTNGQSQQKNEKSTTRKYLKPPRVPQPLPKSKSLNLLSKNAFPQISSLSRWVLTLVKFPYSKKMNLFKMFDFQRILVFKKRPWIRATPLLNQIVRINLLSQIIKFSN